MTNQPGAAKPVERHVAVTIGNPGECAKTISAAIAKRADEICLNCGILDSKDEEVLSIFCSGLGVKDIKEIEVFVEPHCLILAGKNEADATAYRVLPLADEVDPLSVKAVLKQHGLILEIKLRKLGKELLVERRAA
jgi:hypothetical protein